MWRNLGMEELGDLLKRPIVAVLATCVRDSDALLSPVWHECAAAVQRAHRGRRRKVRHLRRDPRAGLVVFDQESPYRGSSPTWAVAKRITAGAISASLFRSLIQSIRPAGAA